MGRVAWGKEQCQSTTCMGSVLGVKTSATYSGPGALPCAPAPYSQPPYVPNRCSQAPAPWVLHACCRLTRMEGIQSTGYTVLIGVHLRVCDSRVLRMCARYGPSPGWKAMQCTGYTVSLPFSLRRWHLNAYLLAWGGGNGGVTVGGRTTDDVLGSCDTVQVMGLLVSLHVSWCLATCPP